MSNDSFIREVEEELRSDRLKGAWDRFGPLILGAAVLIVLGTAGVRGYEWYVSRQASASGDRFLAALNLANDGKSEEALSALNALEADGYGAYPVLARLRAATVLQNDGKLDEAVAAFDAVAADTSVPAALRDMARLRAGYAMVDTADYAAVASKVEALTGDENMLRHAAREVLGLAAWKAEKYDDAKRLFDQIAADTNSPAGIRERAQVMLDLITASGKVVAG